MGRDPMLRLICDSNVVRFAYLSISGEQILYFINLAGITLKFLNAAFYLSKFCRKLSGLGLTGSLGYQLSNLKSVTYL
jgi:hypothetical protein